MPAVEIPPQRRSLAARFFGAAGRFFRSGADRMPRRAITGNSGSEEWGGADPQELGTSAPRRRRWPTAGDSPAYRYSRGSVRPPWPVRRSIRWRGRRRWSRPSRRARPRPAMSVPAAPGSPGVRYDSASRRSFLLTFKTVAIGCSLFPGGFCSKTIIADSEEHSPASSRSVPKAVLRWIRGK